MLCHISNEHYVFMIRSVNRLPLFSAVRRGKFGESNYSENMNLIVTEKDWTVKNIVWPQHNMAIFFLGAHHGHPIAFP